MFGRDGIHLYPGTGRQLIQKGHIPGFRAGVPVLHGSAGIQDQAIAVTGFFRKLFRSKH